MHQGYRYSKKCVEARTPFKRQLKSLQPKGERQAAIRRQTNSQRKGKERNAHLPTNLRGYFVVRQTSGREEGDLLPTGDGVHDVDGGDARLDHGLYVCWWVSVK